MKNTMARKVEQLPHHHKVKSSSPAAVPTNFANVFEAIRANTAHHFNKKITNILKLKFNND
jgi:hypothetical protein